MHAAGGELVEKSRCHLAAPGVLNADEQDLGHVLCDRALDLAERPESLTRESVHEQGNEVPDPRRRKLGE